MVAGQNLGPLTAATPLPSACVNQLNPVYRINTPPGYYLLQGQPEAISCYPSAYAGVSSQYYSPATSCPFGYTPACTSTIGASDTVYTCCPTQFNYICQTTPFYVWESTLGCVISVISSLSTTWTFMDVKDGRTMTSTSAGLQGGMNAFSIQVRFQSSDLTSIATASTNTPSHDPVSGTETAGASPSPNGGLTPGAAAGIAVGACFVLFAIAGAIFMLFRRRRKQHNQLQPAASPLTAQAADAQQQQQPPFETYYYSDGPKDVPEMSDVPQRIYEAPSTMPELDGAAPRRIN